MSRNLNLTYEEAVAKLEEIIGKMESGNLPLDKSIEYFKEGSSLIKYCDGLLNKYEKIISEEEQKGEQS